MYFYFYRNVSASNDRPNPNPAVCFRHEIKNLNYIEWNEISDKGE